MQLKCGDIILDFILGLVLFLFGMNVIENGIKSLSGGRLSGFVEKTGDKPLRGVLIGTVITAVLQSSSAVTVMVVGAVDAGILRLKSAVYIIIGSNIGTSITAWLVCLSQNNQAGIIKSPIDLYPVSGLFGIGLIILTKNNKLNNIGMILVGFTLIMSGINGMSAAVEPVGDSLSGFLLSIDNVFLGIIIGAVLSAVTQSSSAGIGVLQALSGSGTVTLFSAVPIILGQNIGTCVTAFIASIGAGKNAKKAAAAHLLFNVSGTVIWTLLYYIIKGFLPDINVGSVHIALIQTLFNVSTTAIVLWIKESFSWLKAWRHYYTKSNKAMRSFTQ